MRVLIVAGEPGGSIPATRERIEAQLGRAGHRSPRPDRSRPVSFECWEAPGACTSTRASSSARCSIPSTGEPVADGEPGELVVTNLGRIGQPGDPLPHRRHRRRGAPGRARAAARWARLEGGILARADDMVNIRGVNVYPVGIEAVVRRFAEVVEFRSTVAHDGAMRSLRSRSSSAPADADGPALATQVGVASCARRSA